MQGALKLCKHCTQHREDNENKKCSKFLIKIRKLFPLIYFRICCEFYGPALISAFINTQRHELSSTFDFASLFISNCVVFVAFIYPLAMARDLYLAMKTLQPDAILERFPNILKGIKL